ncbi:MAG: SRPBCC domain-containing protein [Bacillati bacterium ANGP1]|uniref:SRPBCC domain-containing protein n=1 Tax=Candidatus Segetimicrobium genomatis TaxID=2569760 RepID=A0A537IJ36_9BACT|nr:MAG: SRPBCC domain-containing protein [Terrabacteria group bacterium ANGP1]
MTANRDRTTAQVQQAIVITRVFDAPRELVWKAWTEPEHFARWYGPKGFTTPVCRIDLRVGGKYLNCMRSPQGQDFWSTGVFREVVAPERLVMTGSRADKDGNVDADWPMETQISVAFEEDDGRTKVTLKHVGMPAGKGREMAEAGWNESLDKLADVLAESRRA